MSPNRTGRGHPPRVGGNESKGTVFKAVKLSIEMWKKLLKLKGKNFSFSEYARGLIQKDMEAEMEKGFDLDQEEKRIVEMEENRLQRMQDKKDQDFEHVMDKRSKMPRNSMKSR
jgi:predicted CopG family antitoxin